MITGRHLDRPCRTDGVTLEESAFGMLAKRADGTTDVVLNETASAIWQLCDGTSSVWEMVDAVCQLFAVSREQATRDVCDAIHRMRTVGLVS